MSGMRNAAEPGRHGHMERSVHAGREHGAAHDRPPAGTPGDGTSANRRASVPSSTLDMRRAAQDAAIDRSRGSNRTPVSGPAARGMQNGPNVLPGGIHRRLTAPALMLASAILVASCVGAGQTNDPHSLAPATAGDAGTQAPESEPNTGIPGPAGPPSPVPSTPVSTADVPSAMQTHEGGGLSVSLRPVNNAEADDLLDHWGRRNLEAVSGQLLQVTESGAGDSGFRALLEAAQRRDSGSPAPGLEDGDAVTVLGQRRGVHYGRWSGGPADTLSIEFDLQYAPAEMRSNSSFRAALERAGRVWSRRIADTWQEWERGAGESRGRLIGNYGVAGRNVLVGPGGETSTGLVIYVTGVDLRGDEAGQGGTRSVRPGNVWEPHTGAIGFDREFVAEAGEADLFRAMVHEIGHVLGAWSGERDMQRYASFTDFGSGTWTGSNVVRAHGRPAPFQDRDDPNGWHGGERSPNARNFDFGHSGVCASIMSYCSNSAGIHGLEPAEIDFAFLRDLGLTTAPQSERPETYGLAGWMDHSAFTLSVSRELDVSLAYPQSRYHANGARWQDLSTTDLLWAEAAAFGSQSRGRLVDSHPLRGTVRWSGGLLGAAVDYPGLPPVHGDATLSIGLEDMTGNASFTSLRMAHGGTSGIFGDGSLHYPIAVEDNGIRGSVPGATLAAEFYGPRHREVAGTLDDSRAGLLASFGAAHDERPAHADVIAEADHVRGLMLQSGAGESVDGWYRYRCGAGPDCEASYEWWEAGNEWFGVSATAGASAREQVLGWTAGWGEWISEDMFADHGGIAISRRYSGGGNGGTGRHHRDGYYGTMKHAAFGTGFYRYVDWANEDGSVWNFSVLGAGFQGELSGTRPTGRATWEGRMLGFQQGLAVGEDPFVQGRATVSVELSRTRVDIGFSDVHSMDRMRSLANFGFDDIRLASDGTFDGHDGGPVEGAFFGPAHQEVAGMFHDNGNSTTGSFGAVAGDGAAPRVSTADGN